MSDGMNDEQLLCYSRQILLADVDITGQETLLNSRVLIMGLGGLGAPVAMYLAAAGVGQITLVDFDRVDLSNLQRQFIHSTDSIGMLKVESAKQRLQEMNPEVNYRTISNKVSMSQLYKEVEQHDVVLDCTDNFPSRFGINQVCVQTSTPLVSGAVIRMEGQISTFDYRQKDYACYQCLYGDADSAVNDSEDTCSTTGVLAPVAGVIGSLQATEALKLLLGLPCLTGRLMIFDAKYMQWREMNLRKDPNCSVCAS